MKCDECNKYDGSRINNPGIGFCEIQNRFVSAKGAICKDFSASESRVAKKSAKKAKKSKRR